MRGQIVHVVILSQLKWKRLMISLVVSHEDFILELPKAWDPWTIRALKRLIAFKDLELVFLCTTRLLDSEVKSIKNQCLMHGCIHFNSNNRSGSLLLWGLNFTVNLLFHSPNNIDVDVMVSSDFSFWYTCFYGHSIPFQKSLSWELIKSLKWAYNKPWLIGGHFVEILSGVEKQGGRRRPKAQMDAFSDALNEAELLDIKPNFWWFTWRS